MGVCIYRAVLKRTGLKSENYRQQVTLEMETTFRPKKNKMESPSMIKITALHTYGVVAK